MSKFLGALLLFISSFSFGVEYSVTGPIEIYSTGWGADSIKVKIAGSDHSEFNCPTQDGYMTSKSDNTGYDTHVSALLAAYMAGKDVRIVVNGCILDRPRIWGVKVSD